ncbi:ATP-grasp domain-containing protein [Cellvibrio sp. pealriver]|uniref:carboxylate--amine ligase n=1 Tax=Cellvibrio sp. pealriver TaxID=1622269 RepID=UPI00066FF2DA|nr:ATP-grasp domain-containing protein [Cellvibrio sp. pealriver]
MTHTILVLDAAQRSALAVTRSLGKLENVRIITADSTPSALAAHSKYSTAYLQSPSSADEPESYLRWIKQICAEAHYSLVIPVTEITSQLLLMHSEQLGDVRLPFANYDTVMSLADKYRLLEQAKSAGVPVPAFRRLSSSADLELQDITYPCVIKPCLSRIYTAKGWISTSVKLLHNEQDLQDALASAPYLAQYPFMIQEFIPGSGAGLFCLYNQGKPVTFFAHKRLREKPPQGGVSVLSESVAVDETLKHYAQQLLDHVQWHGVAMVEFRVTPEGMPYLMEVNTRFWGSLQLSIDAGVDFPRLLVQAELGIQGDIPDNYKQGQRLRWLLGDLDSLYLCLKSAYPLGYKLKRILTFLIPSPFNTRHETNRLGDMGPGIYEFKTYLRQLLGRA